MFGPNRHWWERVDWTVWCVVAGGIGAVLLPFRPVGTDTGVVDPGWLVMLVCLWGVWAGLVEGGRGLVGAGVCLLLLLAQILLWYGIACLRAAEASPGKAIKSGVAGVVALVLVVQLQHPELRLRPDVCLGYACFLGSAVVLGIVGPLRARGSQLRLRGSSSIASSGPTGIS